MKLKQLIQDLQLCDNGKQVEYSFVSGEAEISGIFDNSNKVQQGGLFVAIKGRTQDGHNFIDEAISKGATAIVSQKKCFLPKNISLIIVKNTRIALSCLASSWYGNPSKRLKVIGITGTKGKTTVAHLLFHILQNNGLKVGMVSTVKAIIGDEIFDTGLHVTNPEPLELHKYLSFMVAHNLKYAVIEATSHGLDQERLYGINFDTAILTNIAKEHLDYHKTFRNYKFAKMKLFQSSKNAVLNSDDPSFKLFLKYCVQNGKIVTYSLDNTSEIKGKIIKQDSNTMKYSIHYSKKIISGSISLTGKYNLYNILAAISAAKIHGIDEDISVKNLINFEPPEGRLEKIQNQKGLNIYIDFAHTPDSLENVLRHLKELKANGRLISVFGCAGQRDKNKRFEMGKISAKLSDYTIVTAEDPRNEDVLDICKSIKKGIVKVVGYKPVFTTIPDRFEAIYYAINKFARKGDTVVICGKGHEKSMCYGNIEHPWSDRQSIIESLNADTGRSAIIMGAGLGKRLNSPLPKVIHKLAGIPMIIYTINNLRRAGYDNVRVVVGYEARKVISEIGCVVDYSYQKVRLGTGHAAWTGLKDIKTKEPVLVVNGDDSAFYTAWTFKDIIKSHIKNNAVLTFTSAVLKDPTGIGRLIRNNKGDLIKIVEEKAASEDEKKIKESNIGMYVFDKNWFLNNIGKVKKSAVGEYYITDLIEIAIKEKTMVNIYTLKDSNEWQGVNTPEQLKGADERMKIKLSVGI